eukprot:TRINITY_DN21955_c0_g1_i1.p1 TRINITY_DN21955_c0_g1~~TRINITY_DN21955_c0_g1_i1.p1  ORF type:complete len:225 (+),score=46.52 TRINITY_DN21955_c0_g1_i1:48-722(+)
MSDDHDQYKRYFEEQFVPVYHVLKAKEGAAVCFYEEGGRLLLCYTDMVDERYEKEVEYEEMRAKRDKMKGGMWKEWLGWFVGCLTDETFTTTWNGSNEDGVEVLTLSLHPSVAFDLPATPPDSTPVKTASLAFSLMTALHATRSHTATLTERISSLSRDLTDERAKSAYLKHSLEAFTGGVGIEAHQKHDDESKRVSSSQKRKAQSLVNPCEKIRKPRGTRIGS